MDSFSELLDAARRGLAEGRDRAVERWEGLSPTARRATAIAGGAVIGLIVLWLLIVPALPCGAPGGDRCPPGDDLAALVPADALAYVHATIDPESEQYVEAVAATGAVPLFTDQVVARAVALIPGPDGRPPNFERDLRPWVGGEVALALLAGAGRFAERVELLEIADAEGASAYAGAIQPGPTETETYEGVEISVGDGGLATAEIEGFLAIGSAEGLRAIADAAAGDDSLADDEAATATREQLPEQRFADAYVSAAGATELIGPARGALGSLTPLIAPGSTTGAAASLSAGDAALALAVRSPLDPALAESEPGFFAAFPPFEPGLATRLGAGTLAYLGFDDPATTVGALLEQADAQAPGLVAGFDDLVERLRRRDQVDLETEALGSVGGEAALAVEADPRQGLPYLEFVADEVDEPRARRALASLQGPIAEAVARGDAIAAPGFEATEIEGVAARSVEVSPTVDLTYAIFEGLAVVASSPAAVSVIAGDGERLADSELYQRATAGLGDQVSALGFLDLGGLVGLGERAGLADDPLYATFAGDLRSLDALGVAVTDDGTELATDARLLFGD